MTIHGAKGMQAKFVILPDTTTLPKNKDSVFFDQLTDTILYNVAENYNANYRDITESIKLQTIQEYYRLLYVGLTRASQHLLVCGHSTSSSVSELSWYEIIRNSIEQHAQVENCEELYGYKNISSNINDIIIDNSVDTFDIPYFFSNSQIIYKFEKGSIEELAGRYFACDMHSVLPEFLSEQHVNKKSYYRVSPSAGLLEKTIGSESAAAIGTLTHLALEYFVPLKRRIGHDEVKDFLAIYKDSSLSDFKDIQIQNIATMVNEFILPLVVDSRVETELKVRKKQQVLGKNYFISGSIDLVIFKKNKIYIIDYKSDKNVPKTSGEVEIKYLKQIALYKDMLTNLYPDHEVICYLAWLNRPMLMHIQEEAVRDSELI